MTFEPVYGEYIDEDPIRVARISHDRQFPEHQGIWREDSGLCGCRSCRERDQSMTPNQRYYERKYRDYQRSISGR